MMVKRALLLSVVFLSIQSCSAMEGEGAEDLSNKMKVLVELNGNAATLVNQISSLDLEYLKIDEQAKLTAIQNKSQELTQECLGILNTALFSCKTSESTAKIEEAIGKRKALNEKYQEVLQKMQREIDLRAAKK